MPLLTSALKITGVLSLGVLTGVHFNFSLDTLQALLSLPSAGQAQRAFTTSVALLRSIVRPLELVATASLLTGWTLSSKAGRHPYLWWAAAPVLVSIGIERFKLAGVEYGVQTTQTVVMDSESEGEDDYEYEDLRGSSGKRMVEANGEVVRTGLENWRRWGLIRGTVIGTGFFLSVLGLYGDGY